VRLAHVGNVTKHKGYHLVEAAIRQGGFRNLELTVIDHGLPAGSTRRTEWGGTPVRIAGRVPADQVHELYAETDVLLAPSIWPESFGLVTREALASGCWVIASDRGAMGEDVQPGLNGFVIDVSTIEGLLAALAEIDREPARYLRPPEHRPVLRSADEQAAEVLEVYRRVLEGRPLGQRRPAARVRRDLSFDGVNQNAVAEGAQVGDSAPPRRRR
jgi:glycosyltransferase involved in cell wall biosynthesis